jgi:GTP-binding protein Era
MGSDNLVSKSGFVAVSGRPNVGKSSIINEFLDGEHSIVTPKSRTTHHQIPLVDNEEDAQVVFLDTPGIHRPRGPLGETMNSSAYDSWSDADLILFVVDLEAGPGPGDEYIAGQLTDHDDVIIVAHKSDSADSEQINDYKQSYRRMLDRKIITTTIREPRTIQQLREVILNQLHEGPKFYPRDTIVGRPITFQCAERIRKQVLLHTHEEVPYSSAVLIDRIQEGDDPEFRVIDATIVVERSSQKGIVIGSGGEKIKAIGRDARPDLENLLGFNVYLNLHVTVDDDWTENPERISRYGFTVE